MHAIANMYATHVFIIPQQAYLPHRIDFELKLTKSAMCLNWMQISHSQTRSVRRRNIRPEYTLRILWFWYFTRMLHLYIFISLHTCYNDSWMFWLGVAYHITIHNQSGKAIYLPLLACKYLNDKSCFLHDDVIIWAPISKRSILNVNVFPIVSLNTLLSKPSICWWCETLQPSFKKMITSY